MRFCMSLEQHPVPQNVTTFQFRLIGDMTIKQFLYLAGFALVALICYKFPLPFFVTWPLAAFFALLGIGFAFVPIEDRPMDVWVLSFIKNVYSPTIFTWIKKSSTIDEVEAAPQETAVVHGATETNTVQQPTMPVPPTTLKQTGTVASPTLVTPHSAETRQSPKIMLEEFPATLSHELPTTNAPAVQISQTTKSHQGLFDWFFALFQPKNAQRPIQMNKNVSATPAPIATMPREIKQSTSTGPMPSLTGRRPEEEPVPSPAKTQEENTSTEDTKKVVELEKRLADMQNELTNKSASDARIVELQQQLTSLLREKELLQKELHRVNTNEQNENVQVVAATPTPTKEATVRLITPDAAKSAGLPRLTSFPNVVTGIVKDARGSLLPGVLITVRDKTGIPLRALKTNKLGQFAASTPLSNGEYYIEVEDPRSRYVFDKAQVILGGTLVPAVEITAKSDKEINRERLAKEVFGNQQM